ncbi:MAG: histidine kinase, partial [Ignavibacteria bacterium]|nr:histidine kinase [Ignavibacteria bacterium]
VEKGLQFVNKAFKNYDANKDYAGKFGCINYIANSMIDCRNFELARKYFRMAMPLKDSIKDEYEKSGLYNDIGRMYNYEMKYDSALMNFDLALNESLDAKNEFLIAIARCNIGEVLMKQGNYKKAISTLNLALSEFNLIHFDLGIFQANHLIAFCAYKSNDLKNAELFQNRAEKLLQKTEVYPTLLIDFYQRSYELKKGLGKLNESLAYLEKYQSMQDSVNSRLTNWKINEIESRLFTSVKEKQLVQKESELKQHKSIIWFMASLFFLAALLVGIIALYIRKRREAGYQKQLASMTALRMQNARNTMSPHFFFNVLASLSGLSHEPELLKEKLKSLSLLLRKVIENIDRTVISLDQELEAVKAYIDLNIGKIPEPFTVEYLIGKETNLDGLIPAMMIQIP